MTASTDDSSVGYKRPPKHTRWKKGQSGNPNRKHPVRPISTLERIDNLLLQPIDIVENGAPRRVTALEAILLQLWQKELAGDRRALTVRMKFEELARENVDRGVEIEFVDSAYTRALAARQPPRGDDNE